MENCEWCEFQNQLTQRIGAPVIYFPRLYAKTNTVNSAVVLSVLMAYLVASPKGLAVTVPHEEMTIITGLKSGDIMNAGEKLQDLSLAEVVKSPAGPITYRLTRAQMNKTLAQLEKDEKEPARRSLSPFVKQGPATAPRSPAAQANLSDASGQAIPPPADNPPANVCTFKSLPSWPAQSEDEKKHRYYTVANYFGASNVTPGDLALLASAVSEHTDGRILAMIRYRERNSPSATLGEVLRNTAPFEDAYLTWLRARGGDVLREGDAGSILAESDCPEWNDDWLPPSKPGDPGEALAEAYRTWGGSNPDQLERLKLKDVLNAGYPMGFLFSFLKYWAKERSPASRAPSEALAVNYIDGFVRYVQESIGLHTDKGFAVEKMTEMLQQGSSIFFVDAGKLAAWLRYPSASNLPSIFDEKQADEELNWRTL